MEHTPQQPESDETNEVDKIVDEPEVVALRHSSAQASDSASSTPFGTPEDEDQPLPEVLLTPVSHQTLPTVLPSSPTPRPLSLPEIMTGSDQEISNVNDASYSSSRFAEHRHEPGSPTQDLLKSLKAQLDALSEQRDMLNQKLVTSFSRVADLEDDLFHVKDTSIAQRSQIDELERERKEHLHALDTGLLVEQSNVKFEMQRLAASLLDEQGKRDVAEEGRQKVEDEVDDLAASLFQQANSMVAAERLARSRAETRLATAEENLSVAENVVREMQMAMQALSHSPAPSPSPNARGFRSANTPPSLRHDHVPYAEFMAFISHLRSIRPRHPSSSQPSLTSILQFIQQPFLARMIAEDHEPALRLDFAPGVSWLSKKGISQAVMDTMLIVEPVSASQVFAQKTEGDILCALSGELIAPSSANPHLHAADSTTTPRAPPPPSRGLSFFNRNSPARSASPALPVVPNRKGSSPATSLPPIYVFHIAPHPSLPPPDKPANMFPVAEGWSLERLRATCELWRFVKNGILTPIWKFEDGTSLHAPPLPIRTEPPSRSATPGSEGYTKPYLPPRKKSSSWGLNLGFGKSTGTSAVGWGITRSQPGTPKEEVFDKIAQPLIENENEAGPKSLSSRKVPPPLPLRTDVAKIEDDTTVEEPVVEEPDAVSVETLVTDSAKPKELSMLQSTSLPERNSLELSTSAPFQSSPVSQSLGAVVGDPQPSAPQIETSANSSADAVVPPLETDSAFQGVQKPVRSEEVEETPSTLAPQETSGDAPSESTGATPSELPSGQPPVPQTSPDEPAPIRTSLDQLPPIRTSLDQLPPIRTSLDQQPQSRPSTPSGAPPLPKRAAARRAVPPVPGKTSIGSISDLGSAPVTPTSVSTIIFSPVKEVKVIVQEVSPDEANGEPKSEETAVSAVPEQVANEPKPAEVEPVKPEEKISEEPLGDVAPPVAASLLSASAVEGIPSLQVDQPFESLAPKSDSPEEALSHPTLPPSGDVPLSEDKTQDLPSYTTAPPPLPARKEKVAELEVAEDVEELWEEKTWKELARLRQALFWKRIGVNKLDEDW